MQLGIYEIGLSELLASTVGVSKTRIAIRGDIRVHSRRGLVVQVHAKQG